MTTSKNLRVTRILPIVGIFNIYRLLTTNCV